MAPAVVADAELAKRASVWSSTGESRPPKELIPSAAFARPLQDGQIPAAAELFPLPAGLG
eukprot:9596108-Lingulodinium_polyedra.AAC.1